MLRHDGRIIAEASGEKLGKITSKSLYSGSRYGALATQSSVVDSADSTRAPSASKSAVSIPSSVSAGRLNITVPL